MFSGDGGIRTHTFHVLSVATPAGWSTSPFGQCVGQGSNLPSSVRRLYRPHGLPGPSDASSQWHGWESNPQTPRFELGRYAGSRTVPHLTQAPQTGFEPVTSTLTEWRALQAAPQGRKSTFDLSRAPGGNRTHTSAIPRRQAPVTTRGRCHRPERPVGVEPTLPPWQGSRLPLHHGRVVTRSRAPGGG